LSKCALNHERSTPSWEILRHHPKHSVSAGHPTTILRGAQPVYPPHQVIALHQSSCPPAPLTPPPPPTRAPRAAAGDSCPARRMEKTPKVGR
jgi:hypothetical protein